MNLKIRLALLYSLSVLIILLASAISIYYLSKNNSEKEFEKRLVLEASESGRMFFSVSDPTQNTINKLNDNAFNSLPDEKIFIFNSARQLVYSTPNSKIVNIPSAFFKLAKDAQHYTFTNGSIESVLLYKNTELNEYYVLVSAKDTFGQSKNENLRTLLTFSVLGGILFSGLLAFFYVEEAMKPLEELKNSIEKIDEKNLKERIFTGKNKSEVSQIAMRFNDMLDRLELAFEQRKNFVHHASHELRTPLSIMLSMTESALNKSMNEDEYKKVLASLKEEQQELIDLTNSLLTLSRYEKITAVPDVSYIRIDEMIYDAVDLIKRLSADKTITVDFYSVPEDEKDLTIEGNESLMRSAILNLLRNAGQYSENNEVKATIGYNQSGVILDFDNTGNHLSVEEQRKLFIPFFRGENSAYKKGYGLGLSIVQRIINLHGGEISYQSVGSRINRFTVFLPYVK